MVNNSDTSRPTPRPCKAKAGLQARAWSKRKFGQQEGHQALHAEAHRDAREAAGKPEQRRLQGVEDDDLRLRAPRHFMIAMESSRCCMWAWMAVATPSAPTTSAIRLTRLRNVAERSSARRMAGCDSR